MAMTWSSWRRRWPRPSGLHLGRRDQAALHGFDAVRAAAPEAGASVAVDRVPHAGPPPQAVGRARDGQGPTVIEAQTYRHYGHSRADPATYRAAEEVERWLKHDPLDVCRARLQALGVEPARIAKIDEQAAADVAAAVEAAKGAPDPDLAEAFTDVWADGGAAWRT